MDSMPTVLTFIFWFLTGTACAYFAYQRGRDPYFWFAVGLLFGLLGLIVLVFLPQINSGENLEKELSNNSTGNSQIVKHANDYMIKDWFYIDKSGQQFGPVRFEVLKEMWKDKKIDASSFVWSEGMSEWKKIEEIPNLHQDLQKNETDLQ